MGPRCVARDCANTYSACTSLYRFPKDVERAQIWLKNIDRSDLIEIPLDTLLKGSARVCRKHFQDDMFSGPVKSRLKECAIPVLEHVNSKVAKTNTINTVKQAKVASALSLKLKKARLHQARLRKKLWRAKQKIRLLERQDNGLISLCNLPESEAKRLVTEYISLNFEETTRDFLINQINTNGRSKSSYRWSQTDKNFALSILHSSPSTYRFLTNYFAMPAMSTLKRSMIALKRLEDGDSTFENFCKKVPKIELHAHLNGSISSKTFKKLLKRYQERVDAKPIPDTLNLNLSKCTLEECFEKFKLIHMLINTLDDLVMVTEDVIRDFVLDNVVYLELRTTPKALPCGATKKDYIETVINTIIRATSLINAERKEKRIIVKLLLSLDRGRGLEDAEDTLNYAKYYASQYLEENVICGIDISGFPQSGSLIDFLPLMEEAVHSGLKTSVHMSEVPNDDESLIVLQSNLVDRIGHGCYLHVNSGGTREMTEIVLKRKIPIEICLTSNLISDSFKSIEDNHFQYWYKENHPIILCTDDKGLFCSNLSDEYMLCAQHFGLNEDQILELVLQGVDAIFSDDQVKSTLHRIISDFKQNNANLLENDQIECDMLN